MAAAAMAAFRERMRLEDVLLLLWVLIVGPLFVRAPADGSSFPLGGGNAPLEGILELVGAAGAVSCLLTRGRGESLPETDRGMTPRAYAPLPFMGGVSLVAADGATKIGWTNSQAVFLPILVATFVALTIPGRLPEIEPARRRALVLPVALVGATAYQSVMADFWSGVSPAALIEGFRQTELIVALFVIGLLSLLSLVYYGIFVFAPRQIADPGGSWRAWALRFALYVASVILGLSWLRVVF